MTDSPFEETVRAFEERMALRRKMLKVTGVKLKTKRVPKDVEDMIRDSIFACNDCTSEDACRHWLDTAPEGEPPPAFCPNKETLEKLKARSVEGETIS